MVVQASHGSDLTERADVVLPTAAWLERNGHLTNTEGRTQRVAAVCKPYGNSKQDWEILCDLGLQMGLGVGDLKATVPASASHFG